MSAPAYEPVATPRIAALDLLRGVAVMGILLANLPGFALPEAAYLSPLAWGGSTGADRVAWALTFVLVEGKMRGLFSLLFGASMLLVIDRAAAAGDDPAAVHFNRMGWLFAIGLVHLYGLWWGDILTHYALVGAAAYLFVRLPVRVLLAIGAGLIAAQTLLGLSLWLSAVAAAGRSTPDAAATWAGLQASFGLPPAADLAAEVAAGRGYATAAAWRWRNAVGPFAYLPFGAAETLGYMLFGMAALRSGLLTGAWPRRRYTRWAVIGFAVALPGYAVLAAATIRHGFDVRDVIMGALGLATPLRAAMVAGYAALVMLFAAGDGWLARRIAAAGRTAFSNYLGTTVVMAALFQGLGLFGQVPRVVLPLFGVPVWIAMLAWSQPWLAHFRYGPFEWLWRSLARRAPQPMRR